MNPTAKQSLQALFSALPTADSADPGQTAQCFMLAIEDIPDQFIAVAAKRYIQGRVVRKSHAFLPAAPEFAIEARKCWTEAQCAALPPKALPAPMPSANEGLTPEEVEARKAIVESLNAKLSAKSPAPAPRRHVLTLEDDLAMTRDKPLTISNRFHTLLQEQIAEESEARSRRNYTASHQNDERAA